MLLDPITLGKRIQYFRKREGLSQLQLEAAIDASPGMLSRIENGTVNATKETLQNIIKELNLYQVEADYLIGQTAIPVSLEQENEVLLAVSKEFEGTNFIGYVLDDRWRLVYISQNFLKILGFKEDQHQKVQNKAHGHSTVELLLDDSIGATSLINDDFREQILHAQLTAYYNKMHYMFDDPTYLRSTKLIEADPLASKIWKEVTSKQPNYIITDIDTTISFKILTHKLKLQFEILPLFMNPRFEIIKYRPVGRFNTAIVNTLLKL